MGKRLDEARKFIRRVQSDDVDPLYFLYGDEPYLLDRAVDAVVDAAAPEGTDDFNFDSFRGRDADAESIREAAEMLPMMTDRRVVLVRETQEMPVEELEELGEYFESPAETTCLIFHAHRTEHDDLDLRKSAYRTLKEAATNWEFESLYDDDAAQVAEKHAADHGLDLTSEAMAYLIDAVGTDVATLDRALEKVDLFVGEREESPRHVGVEAVEEIVAETRVRSVFDLTDALGERDYETALGILDSMLLDGEPPLRILYMIARHFRLVARLHDPEVRNKSRSQKARELGVLKMFVDDYIRHARTFSPAALDRIRERILAVDRDLKSTGLSERTILEELLYAICFRDESTRTGTR